MGAGTGSWRHPGGGARRGHGATPRTSRLNARRAGVWGIKLPHLDGWNDRRRKLADAYRDQLADLPIGLPAAEEGRRHVYHLFVIEVKDRDGLRAWLGKDGIETGIHYPIPLHRQPALRSLGYQAGDFPQTERLAAESLSLPMYPELRLDELEAVTGAQRHRFPPQKNPSLLSRGKISSPTSIFPPLPGR